MSEKKYTDLTPGRDNLLVFGAPALQEEEIQEVLSILRSGWIGTGPKVARFESDFAAFKDVSVSHVAAVNSCTAALHLSLIAAGVGDGDEVITTPMTFCATVNAIIHSGATPVLADIDPIAMNIDPNNIEQKITPNTKAILPVHFAGNPCDMDAIMDIANRHGLKVIEDCAHAIESEYKGEKTGTFGDFACFSFYVTKNVATGEGGMVLAREENDICRIKQLALHGMSKDAWRRFGDQGFKHYQIVECGFKYNMMDLQAALGIHQLGRVENNWERRKKVWGQYQDAFKVLPVVCPSEPNIDSRHAYHLYTLLIDEATAGISRDGFLDAMTELNIGVGVHYLSVCEHPFYQEKFGWQSDDCPLAMEVGRKTVSLPLSPMLSDEDVADVIRAVRVLVGA